MRPLNEVAAWIYREIAKAQTELIKANDQEQLWLHVRLFVLNQVLVQLKQAGLRQEKRQKRSIRGVWNQTDLDTLDQWD